jgi:hypothetical protein
LAGNDRAFRFRRLGRILHPRLLAFRSFCRTAERSRDPVVSGFGSGRHGIHVVVWQIAPNPEFLIVAPLVLLPTLGVHAVLSAWSIWVCERNRFSTAWKLVLFPPPAAWILLLLSSSAISNGNARQAAMITGAIAIGSAVVVALTGSRFTIDEGSRDDTTFPIRFAACSNCLALCLLPLLAW